MKEIIRHIKEHTGASIRKICAVLEYSCSSYHASSKPTPTQLQDKVLGDEIEKIFLSHRRRYGYRRVIEDLHDLNLTCSAARARRIMKERGLHAIQPKNFVPKPAMEELTNLPRTFSAASHSLMVPIRSGLETSPSFPPPGDGAISLSSLTSSLVRLSVGLSLITCVPTSSVTPSNKPWDHVKITGE